MLWRTRPRRHFILLTALTAALALIGLVIAYAGRDRIGDLIVAPAINSTPLATPVAVSPEEREFYNYVGPRLRAMTAEAEELVAMGEERSRDVLSLQVRSDRVEELAADIDSYIAQHPVPPRFQAAVGIYQAGIVQVRNGIGEAKSAFLKFDWDAVAAGLDVFEMGTNQVDTAFKMLREVVTAVATPVGEIAGATRYRTGLTG